MSTKSNPDTFQQIRQIHNKGIAVEGKLYYGVDDNNVTHKYRGTHQGRLKEETNLINNETSTSDNKTNIETVSEDLNTLKESITDHHSGYSLIAETEEITISNNKQMVNFGGLIIDGTLNIEGDLILEL